MSQNCKSTYTAATTRDANNNTLYHGGAATGYGGRGYTPPNKNGTGNYQSLKTKVFDQCVLPVLSYGSETWTLTVRLLHKLRVAQRAMDRAILGVSLQVTAKVLFGSVTAINDLKRQEKAERDVRRTH